MSSLTQQQQSQQVQQPSQQQRAQQQGPVPEAAAFGAGNAVEYQGAYGNGAVAGMAGVEGAGVEADAGDQEHREGESMGGELAEKDPALASLVDSALSAGRASASDSASWSKVVPARHQGTVDQKVFGLEALCDYLTDAVSDANACLQEGDEAGYAECAFVLETLAGKADTATRLLEAHRQFYEGTDLTELARTGESASTKAAELAEFDRLHERGLAATEDLLEAQATIKDGVLQIAEINLQTGLQTALALFMDLVVIPGTLVCGPEAPVCAAAAVVVGSKIDGAIDNALGTEPNAVVDGMLKVANDAGTLKSGADAAKTAADLMKSSGQAAKFAPGLGQALTALDAVAEAAASYKQIYDGIADALLAIDELEAVANESEALRDGSLAELIVELEALPECIQLAGEFAEMAAAEIRTIEAEHGGGLYSPV